MGSLPQPITSQPAVLAIYIVLILMIGSALASVLFRRTLYAIGSYCGTMVLIALFYLLLDLPLLLFALQLLVFTTVSAALLLVLVRRPPGIDPSSTTSVRSDWIAGAAVAAGLLALLLVVVVAVTTWPVGFCCGIPIGFAATLSNDYVIGLAVLVLIIASAALGAGLLLAASPATARPARSEHRRPDPGARRPRDRRT
jgi:NADH:ubiquinone oxidoreductase subunit 6 (subunit J)